MGIGNFFGKIGQGVLGTTNGKIDLMQKVNQSGSTYAAKKESDDSENVDHESHSKKGKNFCHACGFKLQSIDARFCQNCGESLN